MFLIKDYIEAYHAVLRLDAERPDNLEDYYHDAIVQEFIKKRVKKNWKGYIYKCVSKRINRGREGKIELTLEEAYAYSSRSNNTELKTEIANALKLLTPQQAIYIYEYYYEGYTFSEIAHRHQASFQAIEQCIKRGLHRMKSML
jgi:DNA-directed RNA polymerase specialized sigma24 family protein